MSEVNKSMELREWCILIVLSILWGGSFFFVEVAVEGLPPFTIVLLRVGMAAAMLHLVLRIRGLLFPMDWNHWKVFLVMGLLNNAAPFSLIVWGQTHITGGLASILNAMTPLFTILVAHLILHDERLTRARIVGILLGIAGVAVIIGATALERLGVDVLAQLAVLGATICYAGGITFAKRFKRANTQPIINATGQLTVSTLLLLPVVLYFDQPWNRVMPDPQVWGAVLGLAILSTALAYVLFFRLLSTAGATNISLVTFFVPVSSIWLGAIFLGERLEEKHFVGMALIGLGLIAIDGRLIGWLKNLLNPESAASRKQADNG